MTTYGRQLLNTLEVSLQSEGSITNVVILLNDLAESLRRDQKIDDSTHEQQEQDCQKVIDEQTSIIKDAELDITRISKNIYDAKASLTKTETRVATKETEIAELENEMQSFTQAHSDDVVDYTSRLEEHVSAQDAIDRALVEMNKLLGSTPALDPVLVQTNHGLML